MTHEDIPTTVAKHPRLNFLQSPEFRALPREKQEFLLQCVEDALFWVELEKTPTADEGFKDLGIAYTRLLSNEKIDHISEADEV